MTTIETVDQLLKALTLKVRATPLLPEQAAAACCVCCANWGGGGEGQGQKHVPPTPWPPAALRTRTHMPAQDLRVQLRARGLQPAGGQEALYDRLKQDMIETKDFALKSETGADLAVVTVTAGQTSASTAAGKGQNNYSRPSGQNTGNFMTERSSSRVTHAPGGASQISFGEFAPQDKVRRATATTVAMLALVHAALAPCALHACGRVMPGQRIQHNCAGVLCCQHPADVCVPATPRPPAPAV